jgi:hypothetical protein
MQTRRMFLKTGIAAATVATPLLAWANEPFCCSATQLSQAGALKGQQMDFEINGFRLHYEIFGSGGEPLLWLHGWTGSGEDWKFVFDDMPSIFSGRTCAIKAHPRVSRGSIVSASQLAIFLRCSTTSVFNESRRLD